MFFYLSKILWFFAQPSSLLFAGVIAGALLAATSWRRVSRGLLIGSLVGLVLCGLLPVADLLTRPLEDRFPRPGLAFDATSLAGIIVLGGAEDRNGWDRGELGGLNEAAERYTETAVADLPPEAETARRILMELGVAPERLKLETQARNTHENAVFSARLLQPQAGERWLLITSAAHMPRAVGCFRKAGFDVVAWPVDYRTSLSGLPYLNSRIPDGLARLDSITREYIGLALYALTGRTSALFPAP
jgi:uncharacterized SAM-binding protein YcdF (DUF218 family)